MNVLVLFGSMVIFILIGVPIGVAVGLSSIITMLAFSNMPMMLLAQYCFTGCNSFSLMAIPCFIIAGVLMGTGGIARRLINCMAVLVGFITGGLALVATIACMFFGAISGSAVATVSAIGTFMIPEMENNGYDKGFSSALMACAGTMGVIIPPSVPLVIYAIATNTSVGDLFKAGILPGVLMALGLCIASFKISKDKGYVGVKRVSFKEGLKIIWDAKLALLSPVIILGGIYAGIFTPTEASIVAVVYSLVVGVFCYKELNFKTISNAFLDAAIISAVTMFLIGFATSFANYLTLEKIPQMLGAFLTSITESKIVLLLLINIFLLLVGMLIDNIPAVLILAPIFLPIVQSFGMSPIHFGVVMTMNLAIGFVSPPYGVNLFCVTALADISFERVVKNLLPFMIALIAVLMVVTYVPFFTMWLI